PRSMSVRRALPRRCDPLRGSRREAAALRSTVRAPCQAPPAEQRTGQLSAHILDTAPRHFETTAPVMLTDDASRDWTAPPPGHSSATGRRVGSVALPAANATAERRRLAHAGRPFLVA